MPIPAKYLARRKAFKATRRKRITINKSRIKGKAKINKVTSLTFRPSRYTHQIVPDRYFCWLEISNMGNFPSASASGSYGMLINTFPFPFNLKGVTPAILPALLIGANVQDPSGYKNIIYNATTSTGLYGYYRVWSVAVTLVVMPQITGDNVVVGMAPITPPSTSGYPNVIELSQSPNNVTKTCTPLTPKENVLYAKYSFPSLLGCSKKDYGTLGSQTNGSNATAPAIPIALNIVYQTLDQQNTANTVGYSIKVRYHVEFFGRTDQELLDS